nr:unnamed protein product [Callosobruchus chinensis]
MNFETTSIVCALEIFRRKTKRLRRKYWVHPIYCDRLLKGKFYTLFHTLRNYPDKFFNYFRMSKESFDELLSYIKDDISYQNTNMRLSIPPEKRLKYFSPQIFFNIYIAVVR